MSHPGELNHVSALTYDSSLIICPFDQIHKENMLAALSPDMLATDLAYYLARKGVRIYFRGIIRFTPTFEWQN